MSVQQLTKIRVSPFNTAKYDPDAMDFAALSGTTGAVNNGAGYAKGTTTFLGDGAFIGGGSIDGMLISFVGHDQEYYVSSTSTSGGSKSIVIEPALVKAVVDNEAFYVLQPTDITDCTIDISNIEYEIEVNQNERVLDKQVRIRLFNFDDTFYDRDTFTSAYASNAALFTTRNTQSGVDNKYISILIYNTVDEAWYQIYAGQIVRDETVLSEPESEIRLLCESVFYKLNDIILSDASELKNCNKYTSETNLTKSIHGRYMEVIVSIAHLFGIPKKNLSVTSREKNSGQCKIGFASDPKIITGEYIEVNSSLGIDYAGKFRCDGVELVGGIYYMYYHFGTNSVAVDNTDVSNAVIAHRVFFDNLTDFFNEVHAGTSYGFDELFFIARSIVHDEISEERVIDILNEIHKTFVAFSCLRFFKGIAYCFFRSKNNTSGIKITLGQDHFIENVDIESNWRFLSTEGVICETTVKLSNDISLYYSENYNTNLWATVDATGSPLDKSVKTIPILDNLNNTGSIDLSECDVEKISFSNHDGKYKFSADTSEINIKDKLKQAVPHGSTVFASTENKVNLKYADAFNIKLKQPIIYVANLNLSAADTGELLKYEAAEINDWTLTKIDDLKRTRTVSIVPFLPADIKDDLRTYNPFAYGVLTISANGDSLGSTRRLSCYGLISDSGKTNSDYITTDTGISTASGGSGDWVEFFGSDTRDLSYAIILPYINSNNGYCYFYKIAMESGSEYYDTDTGGGVETKIIGTNGIYKYSATNTLQTSLTSWNDVKTNSKLSNPYSDNKVLVADMNSGSFLKVYTFNPSFPEEIIGLPVGLPSAILNTSFSGSDVEIQIDNENNIWFYDGGSGGTQEIYKATYSSSYATITSMIGGGATVIPSKGSSVSGLSNLLFDNVSGIWVSYDGLVFATNTDSAAPIMDAVVVCDIDNDVAYTIDRTDASAYLVDPVSISGIDFINTFQPISGSDVWLNVTYLCSKLNYEYYSKDRRIVKCSLRWQDIDYLDIGLGDRIALDTTVVANDTYDRTIFWITKLSLNLETHEYDIELLEDTNAQQGIGAMRIGSDFRVR